MELRAGARKRTGGAGALSAAFAYRASFEALRVAGFEMSKQGQRRSTARSMAMHLAMEAFGVRGAAVSRAAGVGRRAAGVAIRRVWERRDADPLLDERFWALTGDLKGEA